MKQTKLTKLILLLLLVFSFGFVLPEQHQIPVKGATAKDWNSKSFWYYPWGRSRVHKGIDIFAKNGTTVIAPTGGLVLFNGTVSMGGHVVYMIGPKWRFHYFAHLQESKVNRVGFIDAGQVLGRVGTSGNAAGKSPHLHYSIKSLFPRLWKYNPDTIYNWQRLFFVDPGKYLLASK